MNSTVDKMLEKYKQGFCKSFGTRRGKELSLVGADLSRADLRGLNLECVSFKNTKLRGAFYGSRLSVSSDNQRKRRFYRAFSCVHDNATYGKKTVFPRGFSPKRRGMVAIAAGVNLNGANLSGVDIKRTELFDASLKQAVLSDTNL